MANANISVVTLSKTFDEWRVATNDLITDRNILRNANYVKDDGTFIVSNGEVLISRTAGGVTLTNDNDALNGGTLTTTDLVTIDDATIGKNATLPAATAVLTVNNNILTRNLVSNSLITAANVDASGFLVVRGGTRDSQNNILNVNSTLYMSNSGAINVNSALMANGVITANKATGTGLLVVANAAITGNLIVSSNSYFSQNIEVTDTVNTLNTKTTGLVVLGVANIATGNIVVANIATLNVNAAGSFANIANLRVANSNTVNAIIDTLSVLTRANFSAINVASGNLLVANIATLNVNSLGSVANIATLNVTNQSATLMNVAAANVITLEVVSLTVKDPIIAPSESDSSSYRLRVAQTTRGDGSFGVRLGSAANGNAFVTFDTAAGNVWRLTSNSTEGLYHTILTTRNLSSSVTTTDSANAATLTGVKTAYDQASAARDRANVAYDTAIAAGTSSGVTAAYNQANAAANLVAVYANGSLRMANANVNFINSATVNVSVTANATNKFANVEFTVNPSGSGIASAYNQANVATTAAAAAMNYRGIVVTDYSDSNTNYRLAKSNGFYYLAGPSDSRSLLTFTPGGSTSTVQMEFGYNDIFRWRSQIDFGEWTAFRSIWHTGNFNPSSLVAGSSGQVQYNSGSSTFAGSSQFVFDSNLGNLGIGTNSPATKLDIRGTSGVGLQIYENSTGNDNRIIIAQDGTISRFTSTYFSGSGNFAWNIGLSELMRLTSSGNLGIGTTTASEKLEVNGNIKVPIGKSIYCYNDSFGIGTPDQSGLQIWAGGGGIRLGARNSGVFSDQVYIDAVSGYMGIGTVSPTHKLSIAGSGGTSAIKLTESAVREWRVSAGGAASGSFDITDLTSGAPRLFINSSGNVGIGTTSPTAKLHVQSLAAGAAADKVVYQINDYWNNGGNGQFFKFIGGPAGFSLLSNYGNLSFGGYEGVSDTPRNDLFVSRYIPSDGSGGNVGIGTTSTTSKLSVAGQLEFKTGGLGIKFADGTTQTTADGGGGSVSSVATSGALTGGTITSSGTLGVRDASTSQNGVVQLTDSVSSTSTTTAATPASVKVAYDKAAQANTFKHVTPGYTSANVYVSASSPSGTFVAGDIWIEV